MKHAYKILILGLSLFLVAACASSKNRSSSPGQDKDTRIFNGGMERIIELTADAIKEQGLGIDDARSAGANNYVIVAHLTNEYMSGSSNTGYSSSPRESQVKCVISYIGETKTKVKIDVPEKSAGVSYTYSKHLRSRVFSYINRNL